MDATPQKNGVRRPVTIFKTTDVFVTSIPWGDSRAVLVHRREHGGRTYVRFRTWNRHREKMCWYPTKRGFIVPIQNAQALAKSLISAVDEDMDDKPDWLLGWEESEKLRQELGVTAG